MTPSIDPNERETLREALRLAAEHLRTHEPDPKVPAAAWAAMPPALVPVPRHAPWWLAWTGGGLAFATLAIAALVLATAPPGIDDIAHGEVVLATPFLPVVAADRWPELLREARENGPAWVVPAELPRESLAAMGLPCDPARAGEPVRAELLVHASGDVLAVRFVR